MYFGWPNAEIGQKMANVQLYPHGNRFTEV